jgi:hypothetical protein
VVDNKNPLPAERIRIIQLLSEYDSYDVEFYTEQALSAAATLLDCFSDQLIRESPELREFIDPPKKRGGKKIEKKKTKTENLQLELILPMTGT